MMSFESYIPKFAFLFIIILSQVVEKVKNNMKNA